MRSWIARRMLRATSKRYGYDTSYLDMMLSESPAAFFKFASVVSTAWNPAAAASAIKAPLRSCSQPLSAAVTTWCVGKLAPSLALRDLQPPRDDFFREAEFCTRDRGFCEIFGLP